MSSRTKGKNFEQALKKPYAKNFGLLSDPSAIYERKDNNYCEQFLKADGVGYVDGTRIDINDKVHFGGAPIIQPMSRPITFVAVANGNVVTTTFHVFTANAYGRITRITESHTTAGNDSGAVTGHITKERGVESSGAGTAVMTNTFNLKGTADTRQSATLSTNETVLAFAPGDRLSFKLTGTATTCAGVRVTVWVQYTTNIFETSVYLAGGTQDQCFFIANRKYSLNAVSYIHRTKEATATTMAVQLVNDTSTNAPGAGTDILTNNTNAGFSCVGANNTVQVGTFAATSIAVGNRLSLDFSTSGTELAFLCVTVAFDAQPGRQEISAWWYAFAATDFNFFSADRDYRLFDARQLHAVAAGGASTAQLTKDPDGTAPGAGSDLLTTAWNLNATANTVQVLDPITVKATLQLNDGDRLGVDFANAIQSSAGFAMTVSLIAE